MQRNSSKYANWVEMHASPARHKIHFSGSQALDITEECTTSLLPSTKSQTKSQEHGTHCCSLQGHKIHLAAAKLWTLLWNALPLSYQAQVRQNLRSTEPTAVVYECTLSAFAVDERNTPPDCRQSDLTHHEQGHRYTSTGHRTV